MVTVKSFLHYTASLAHAEHVFIQSKRDTDSETKKVTANERKYSDGRDTGMTIRMF